MLNQNNYTGKNVNLGNVPGNIDANLNNGDSNVNA